MDWPARLQRLTRGPLVEALQPGCELWLDGGHNPSAGEALARSVESWRDLPLRLVLGILDTKDPQGYLRPLRASSVEMTNTSVRSVASANSFAVASSSM